MLRLHIFAFHVSRLMADYGEFELHPCNGVQAKVKIVRRDPNDSINDECWINGKSVGNRCGAVTEFTNLVNQVQPAIDFDQN